MKLSKTTFWNLFLLFEIILVIKIIPVFLTNGPYIIPDESCIMLRATHFIENFKITPCKEITLIGGGDTSVLYSILISPIFLFTYGLKAFHATQIFNIILLSSLIFPIFGIIKKFTTNEKAAFGITALLLFLPQITVYEKTLMTESLFFFIITWIIYFYLHSFSGPHKSRNKRLSILFSILAVLARPFGFIAILAITINEIIVSKKNKKILLFLIPLSIILVGLTFNTIIPSTTTNIAEKLQSLGELSNWKLIFEAIVSQTNSLILATYFIPIIIFFTYLWEKDSKDLKNIRWFLLSYIILNLIISAQHIYGYLLDGNDPNLLTRYIHTSIIIIFLFAGIFFTRYKTFKINKGSITIFAITMISLFLFKDEGAKLILNLDLSIYYDTRNQLFGKDTVISKGFLGTFFIPIIFILFILLIKNKRKILTTTFTSIIIITSLLSTIWATNFVMKEPITQFLIQTNEDRDRTISFIYDNNYSVTLGEMWLTFSLTKDNLNLIIVDKQNNQQIDPEVLKIDTIKDTQSFKEADFIISTYSIPELPLIIENIKGNKIYQNIYKET